MSRELDEDRRYRFWLAIADGCLIGSYALLLVGVSVLVLKWLQPKPKLPRATPLITATDIIPEEK